MILSGDESLKKWLIVNLKAEVIKEIEALRDECQLKVKRAFESFDKQAAP